jgi:hypothetical protein
MFTVQYVETKSNITLSNIKLVNYNLASLSYNPTEIIFPWLCLVVPATKTAWLCHSGYEEIFVNPQFSYFLLITLWSNNTKAGKVMLIPGCSENDNTMSYLQLIIPFVLYIFKLYNFSLQMKAKHNKLVSFLLSF